MKITIVLLITYAMMLVGECYAYDSGGDTTNSNKRPKQVMKESTNNVLNQLIESSINSIGEQLNSSITPNKNREPLPQDVRTTLPQETTPVENKPIIRRNNTGKKRISDD